MLRKPPVGILNAPSDLTHTFHRGHNYDYCPWCNRECVIFSADSGGENSQPYVRPYAAICSRPKVTGCTHRYTYIYGARGQIRVQRVLTPLCSTSCQLTKVLLPKIIDTRGSMLNLALSSVQPRVSAQRRYVLMILNTNPK